ncbi:hypothetical protein [Hymenobacter sp.]|uniref:hypothetical protein n=1 Tax=Hymenobacter sp. TaxID=1898978 RepID=UPI002EDAA9A5
MENFWRAYDKLATAKNHSDSLSVVKTHYLDVASPGLLAYAAAANATAADFLRAWRTHRQYLTAIRPATNAIGQQRPAIVKAARKLKKAYPAATFPDLYFAIGKFEVGGTAFDNLLYVGAELKCAAENAPLQELRPDVRDGVKPVKELPTVCLHEIVHGQQRPKEYRSNLEGALREGAAEYVAYRLTGHLDSPAAFAYGRKHEATLRQQFSQEADQPITAKWFLATADASGQRPGALAYFVGFRICEAYYAQAQDKKAALQTLIALSDLPALLVQGRQYLAR